MNTKFQSTFIVSFTSLVLSACGGGGSDSGFGESLAHEREALSCVSIVNSTIQNFCNYAIIVRIFAGAQVPITIAANSSAEITDPGVVGLIKYGACRSPFTPVEKGDEFECI